MEALRALVAVRQEQQKIDLSFKAFGRSEMGVVEVGLPHLLSTAMWLRSDESLRFDWMEMLSVHEKRNRLHLSYILRSQARSESCLLRTTVEIVEPRRWVQVPSLVSLWPMVKPFEQELSGLFGILFTGSGSPATELPPPDDFPLRKSFRLKSGGSRE